MMHIRKKLFLVLIAFVSCPMMGEAEEQAIERIDRIEQVQQPFTVLFVFEYFPAPSQTYVLNIITGLIDRGHKVSIFAFRKNDVAENIVQPNVEKYSLMDHVTYDKMPKKLPDCDIIFCQSASLGKKLIENKSLQKWLDKRKLVIALRGADISKYSPDNNPYERLFRKARLFLPVCDFFKQRAIELGCPRKKIMVHHSAIDCDQFFFREREKEENGTIQCVSVCRLIEKKGIAFAIKAVARLIKKYNLHFTIVGQGVLQPLLEELAQQLNVADKITFFGWGTHADIVKILDTSHIFLSPSITSSTGDQEGIANTLKEAMAMGVIPVATMHAGTPELIEDGVSGFLVPEKNSKALAEKIQYVIEHPEKWKSIGMAARKKIEDEFEMKKTVEELEQIFYQLVG